MISSRRSTSSVRFYLRVCVPVDDGNCIFFGWRAHDDGEFHGKDSDPSYNGWNRCSLEGQSEQETYDLKQRNPGDWEAQSSQWGGISRHQIEHLSSNDGGVALTRRVLRNILEGDVPSAWPEPTNGNSGKPRLQNIYSQNSVCNIRRQADTRRGLEDDGGVWAGRDRGRSRRRPLRG